MRFGLGGAVDMLCAAQSATGLDVLPARHRLNRFSYGNPHITQV